MQKVKRKIYKFLPLIKPIIGLALLILLVLALRFLFPYLKNFIDKTFKAPRLAYSFLTADTSSLESWENRVNLLILGASGGDHSGRDLTDTMIFVSIDKTTADIVMLSIPRDIWLDSLQAKINSAYHYGEEKKAGGGFILAKDAVYEVFNQPIHYSLLLDFAGFAKIINLLGGIDIKVDRSFDDLKYPIAGKENDECNGDREYKCRYEQVHFDKGVQHMDGETTLMFVRSRNAEGEEGTDFARSLRQQKVILAIKDKIFNLKFLLNPKKILEVKQALGDNFKLDRQLTEEQTTAFLSLFLRFVKNKNTIRTISLDTGNDENLGFLYSPDSKEYGQWVLIPRDKTWQEIHRYIKDKIEKRY
ncbi:hypothetical protein A3J78_02110 [Candidatus Beckwithbacteria bacterium RBG_13_35_6]|uniref:Cell envelope-related transcriptional attenuator domain-containing protein n=1 Tax=Candidatus Beckwithbacteria bacterium RBG_13_35_6 TaxID=1797456 RepID=A0A1F5DF81_9BACT|nr:MAG: hypothetical protein A3J78_02110 [Candidatus Beckwithbacteria bacterium RBG_13_35_6]